MKRGTKTNKIGLLLSAAVAVLAFSAPLPARAQPHIWRTEVADGGPNNVGKSPCLVVDHDGNLHIAYYDETARALLYTFQPAGGKRWFKMTVAAGDVGDYMSVAVDAADHPQFSYVSFTERGLFYAHWDGKKWHKQLIDPESVTYFTSIQLDSQDHPHISYYHRMQGKAYALQLKYAHFDGKQWFIETVDQREGTGKFNSLAVDSKGDPHIAYSYIGPGDMLYASSNGQHWSFSAIDLSRTTNSFLGAGNSIAVDAGGIPHVAYWDLNHRTVKYGYWTGTAWKTEVVDKLNAIAEQMGAIDHVSLKMDSQGQPHVAYYDAGLGVLKYAVRTSLGWRTEVVDRSGNVGMYPSLCLDAGDHAYIAYYDVSNNTLKLAREETVALAEMPAARK